MPASEHPVTIRAAGSIDPVPEGSIAEPMMWDGRAIEVVFDPQRVTLLRVSARAIDDTLRRRLTESGWHHAGTDTERAELWIGHNDELGQARLDRLASRPPAVASPSIGLS